MGDLTSYVFKAILFQLANKLSELEHLFGSRSPTHRGAHANHFLIPTVTVRTTVNPSAEFIKSCIMCFSYCQKHIYCVCLSACLFINTYQTVYLSV